MEILAEEFRPGLKSSRGFFSIRDVTQLPHDYEVRRQVSFTNWSFGLNENGN